MISLALSLTPGWGREAEVGEGTTTPNNSRYGLDFRNPSHPPRTHTGALWMQHQQSLPPPPSSWAGPTPPPRPHLLQSGEGLHPRGPPAPSSDQHLFRLSVILFPLSPPQHGSMVGRGNEGELGPGVQHLHDRRTFHIAKNNRSAHSSGESSA